MPGFAVYTTSTDPDCLYSTGDTEPIDAPTTAQFSYADGQPLEFVIDLAASRLWWQFEADHQTKATRRGQFITAYQADDDMFSGLARELRQLHTTANWALPYTGEFEQEVGFVLWRLNQAQIEPATVTDIATQLQTREPAAEPHRVTVDTRRDAFELVRAIAETDQAPTIAVTSHLDYQVAGPIDVVITIDQSPDAADTDQEQTAHPASTTATASATPPESGVQSGLTFAGLATRVAGLAIIIMLGFAAYSFVSRQPLQPISGLATFGALCGTVAALGVLYGRSPTSKTPGAWVQAHSSSLIRLLSVGTFVGFVYPRIMWTAGQATGQSGFLFGSLTTLSGALPATLLYTGSLYVGSMIIARLGSRLGIFPVITQADFLRLLPLMAVYGLSLLLATGLADQLWYEFIPVT